MGSLFRGVGDFFGGIVEWLGRLFPGQPAELEPPGLKPAPVTRRVLLVVYSPRVSSEGGRTLSQVLGWNDPDRLATDYIRDVRDCSDGYADFQIVERIEVDGFPAKVDGFVYTGDEYVRCWRAQSGFHTPDAADYARLLAESNLLERVRRNQIDEVWFFAFPYAGLYESIMAGPGAFYCNAPPLDGTAQAGRRFIIMGFNVQRGVGEMLENLGHRAEDTLAYAFRARRGDANLWERFTRYDKTHPGRAEVGTIHFAPNSDRDYDWGNRRKVLSRCDTWTRFPDLSGAAREVDCNEWGGGEIRAHHVWWFRHFPRLTGASDGIAYNWWKYVVDANMVS